MSIDEDRKEWVVLSPSEMFGLVSAFEIKLGLRNGALRDDDCVWRKKWPSWKRIKDIPLFIYECRHARGADRPVAALPVPGMEEFKHVVAPSVSPNELCVACGFPGLRAVFLVGSLLVGGIPGAKFASCIANRKNIGNDVLMWTEAIELLDYTLSEE